MTVQPSVVARAISAIKTLESDLDSMGWGTPPALYGLSTDSDGAIYPALLVRLPNHPFTALHALSAGIHKNQNLVERYRLLAQTGTVLLTERWLFDVSVPVPERARRIQQNPDQPVGGAMCRHLTVLTRDGEFFAFRRLRSTGQRLIINDRSNDDAAAAALQEINETLWRDQG